MNRLYTPGEQSIPEAEKYKERLAIALKAARICVYEVDVINQRYTFFENSEDIFGVPGDVILRDVQPYSRLSPQDYQKAVSAYFSHPDDAGVIDCAFQHIFRGEATTYEARMKAAGSNYIWCKLDVTPIVENGVTVKMIGVITDISNIKSKTDRLTNAAHRDSFSGLYNKEYAISSIRAALKRSPDQLQALILSDINNFKFFNDTYGHAEGDKIILSVARTLKESFRATDIIGRFGGDEFIALIQDIPNADWLTQRLQRLCRSHSGTYLCTSSVGIALFPQDAHDFETLFRKADRAMYYSKFLKKGPVFYSDVDASWPHYSK